MMSGAIIDAVDFLRVKFYVESASIVVKAKGFFVQQICGRCG